MELFSEIYNIYFHAVEKMLRSAGDRLLSDAEMQKTLSEGTFSESAISMLPKLQNGVWPLLRQAESGYIATCVPPEKMPLTVLQRAWIKAMLGDSRIRLFLDDGEIEKLRRALSEVDPLYLSEDFFLFDKAAGGDSYDHPAYRQHFRLFLSAIRERTAIHVQYEGGKGHRVTGIFWPHRLEYSQKDNKFRAHCYRKNGNRKVNYVLNLGRITSAELAAGGMSKNLESVFLPSTTRYRQVIIEITKERNALERCMVHFAHFEKRAEYDETSDKYTCAIRYNVMDESEVVIRVLSFGPTIKVLGPDEFAEGIRNRVKKQIELLKTY